MCRELYLVFALESELSPAREFDFLPITGYPIFFITPPDWSASLEGLGGRSIESTTQRPGIEALCCNYGIVPGAVRYVCSFTLLSTLVMREEGFAMDCKLVDAKEKHAMRYTHHRGLARVTNWVRLKYAAMNLKKLAE